MEQTVIGSFGFLRVLVLQWNSHPYFLIYFHSKSKLFHIFKNGTKTPKTTNLYLGEHLFKMRYSRWGKKPETSSERSHFTSGRFVKVLYKKTICPKWPLLNGPKTGYIYIYTYIYIYIYIYIYYIYIIYILCSI